MTVLDYYKVADKNYFIEFYGPNGKKYYGSTLQTPGIVEYLQNCEVKTITRSFSNRTVLILSEEVANFTNDNPIYKNAIKKIKELLVRKGEAEILDHISLYNLRDFAYSSVGYSKSGNLRQKSRKYILDNYSKQIFEYILKLCDEFFIGVAIPIAATGIDVGWPDYEG